MFLTEPKTGRDLGLCVEDANASFPALPEHGVRPQDLPRFHLCRTPMNANPGYCPTGPDTKSDACKLTANGCSAVYRDIMTEFSTRQGTLKTCPHVFDC